MSRRDSRRSNRRSATVPQQAFVRALLAVARVESGSEDRANELFDWFVADGLLAVPDDTVFGPTFGMWLEVGWALRRVDRREAMEAWLRWWAATRSADRHDVPRLHRPLPRTGRPTGR